MRSLTALFALAATAALAAVLPSASAQEAASAAPPPNFKVAFIGDQEIDASAQAVLQLIADEGADMVLHQGDLGYGAENDPQTASDWDAQITSILGADYPYFASVGNHDVGNWPAYQSLLVARLALVPGASCTGDYGVMATCTYQGLYFILSGAGAIPNAPDDATHIDYIRDQLAADNSIWRICSWHKNQNAMQLGTKSNEVGWGPYETCRQGRAIIATGHEHSYSRTRTLSNIETQTIDPAAPAPDDLRVSTGSTFVFVSGLAGRDIRNQDRCLPTTPPYGCSGEWASIYTSDQSANFGALFIEFHVDGDPNKAAGYFKNIDGTTIDSFTITSDLSVGGRVELPYVIPERTQGALSGDNATLLALAAAAIAVSGTAGVWYVRWWRRR